MIARQAGPRPVMEGRHRVGGAARWPVDRRLQGERVALPLAALIATEQELAGPVQKPGEPVAGCDHDRLFLRPADCAPARVAF